MMKNYSLQSLAQVILATFLLVFSIAVFASPMQAKKPIGQERLFVQITHSAVLVPNKKQSGSYLLKLKKVDPYISYFTDQPVRKAGLCSLKTFYQHWTTGKIYPNVAMEGIEMKTGKHITRIFELSKPQYNNSKHTVTYNANMIGKQTAIKASEKLGYTVLFVDDFTWGGNKFQSGG